MKRMKAVFARVRSRARPAVVFSLAFTGVSAAVFVPLTALVVRTFLKRWGRASVGNFEIASFMLSVDGIVATLIVGTLGLFAAQLHLAGLLEIVGEPPKNALGAARGFLSHGKRLLVLALRQTVLIAAVATPCLLAAFLVARWATSGHDLNALLVLRPPAFWIGLAGASVPLIVLVVLVVLVVIRRLFSVPAMLDDASLSVSESLRRSAALSVGCRIRILVVLTVGIVVTALAAALVLVVLRFAALALLGAVGTSGTAALVATGTVLFAMTAATAVVAWLGDTTLVALVWVLYREACGEEPSPPSPQAAPTLSFRKPLIATAAVLVVVGLCAMSTRALLRDVVLNDHVEITAHRAGAIAAPENTIAALRHAIEDGADWAEIDVQLTKDRALVVLHDFDLVRIGGPRKKVADATLEEVRAIEVGRALRLDPLNEKVPTFDEFLAAAGDRIRLNVELKPPDAAAVEPLVAAVIEAIRKTGMTSRCRICSQSYDGIQRAKRLEPSIKIGFIAGAAVGDLSRLSVDYLMVNKKMATRDLVEDAHARGIEVHPWTINDPADLLELVDVGVDNVITDAPGPFRARLGEIRALPVEERLLLRAREVLAR